MGQKYTDIVVVKTKRHNHTFYFGSKQAVRTTLMNLHPINMFHENHKYDVNYGSETKWPPFQ